MILLEGRIGDANLIFPHVAMLRTKVTLPAPVTKAKVLLRGFDFANAWDDRNLLTMRVRLDLGYGDGANEVEVIATLELADESPTGEPMQVEVLFTLIGE
jgi:hypothetical protein